MNHTAIWPVRVLCHRMSGLASALKSGAANGTHSSAADDLGSGTATDTKCVPSMNHTATWPVRVLCHRMSGFESALRSAAANGTHSGAADDLGSGMAEDTKCVPSMNHTATCPVVALCHRMSGLASALKSVQLLHGVGATMVIDAP